MDLLAYISKISRIFDEDIEVYTIKISTCEICIIQRRIYNLGRWKLKKLQQCSSSFLFLYF
jgi:hypothetical protein